jgi:hypothetical protein
MAAAAAVRISTARAAALAAARRGPAAPAPQTAASLLWPFGGEASGGWLPEISEYVRVLCCEGRPEQLAALHRTLRLVDRATRDYLDGSMRQLAFAGQDAANLANFAVCAGRFHSLTSLAVRPRHPLQAWCDALAAALPKLPALTHFVWNSSSGPPRRQPDVQGHHHHHHHHHQQQKPPLQLQPSSDQPPSALIWLPANESAAWRVAAAALGGARSLQHLEIHLEVNDECGAEALGRAAALLAAAAGLPRLRALLLPGFKPGEPGNRAFVAALEGGAWPELRVRLLVMHAVVLPCVAGRPMKR